MSPIDRKLHALTRTHGVMGASFRDANLVGTYAIELWPSKVEPVAPGVPVMLQAMFAAFDAAGHAGLLDRKGIRIKLRLYSVIAMSGPHGTVAIAYLNGHPAVKSINRPARSIVGQRARPEPVDELADSVASVLGGHAHDRAVLESKGKP